MSTNRLLADCYEVDGVENGRYHDIVNHIMVSHRPLACRCGDRPLMTSRTVLPRQSIPSCSVLLVLDTD